jgi:selenocysteine-specific elongation factor
VHVLGTAGHVDHGKSALIQRLTGIDPDRLAEEKARGLTIDLGFAWLTLPTGREVGIVDVPGHERFVHNMLAGAGSIDGTIFVVAANEGWKPQSEEHLAIIDLLGARGGVIALTKRDLVSTADLALAAEEILRRTSGTALAGAEVVPVSSTSGEGIDELLAAIDSLLERTPPAPDRGRPRLFVDRSFSIKGAGTVVTGTLTGGRLRAGDEIEVLPAGVRGRIRSIQTHKRSRQDARPGSRAALNVAGIDRHEIARGDAIVAPGRWRATDTLDVWIRPVRALDHPIAARGAYKLYLGAAEVGVRLRLLDAGDLAPGGEAFARLRANEPLVAEAFDRFVLRDSGRGATVAGGLVLDPHPVDRRLGPKTRATRVDQLRARKAGGRARLAEQVARERGVVAAADMRWLAGAEPEPGPLRGYTVSGEWFAAASGALERAIAAYHAEHPLARGIPREDARAASGFADPKLFAALVDALAGMVAAEGPLLRLVSHAVTLTAEQRARREQLMAALEAAAFAPPPLDELRRAHGEALLSALVDAGDLVAVGREHVLTQSRYAEAKRLIAGAIRAEGPVTASRIRDLLGTSRKYALPLLEHLDAAGFTKRRGDVRILADPA